MSRVNEIAEIIFNKNILSARDGATIASILVPYVIERELAQARLWEHPGSATGPCPCTSCQRIATLKAELAQAKEGR